MSRTGLLSELEDFRQDPSVKRRHVINLKHDYMVSGPALAAGIPLLHNRAGPVRRDEIMTFFSCNRLAGLETGLASQSF